MKLGTFLAISASFITGAIVGGFVVFTKLNKERDDIIASEVEDVRAYYKKKEKALDEEKEIIRKQRCEELIQQYHEKAEKGEVDPYPSTVPEIEEYNFDNDLYKGIEFLTEEDYEYDEDAGHKKIECRMFIDGTVVSTAGVVITEDSIGNLCSGMGIEDCLRYIRNWEEKVDYRIEYFDEDYEPEENE